MPVTTTTSYGSKTYENLVLKHTPTAVFGPYASATSTISDITNKNYLTASFVAGASFSAQIPFFTLASDQYTFAINSSNKIVIKENTASYAKALGTGKFSSGDEESNFAIEFLISKNYEIVSNNDFARFGFLGTKYNIGLSYSNLANEFYLNIYSISGGIIYRISCPAGPNKTSKHIVINFNKGKPSMYVNGVVSKNIINNLNTNTFFASKSSGRTVAEFSCTTGNESLLISMISFYNYCLSEEIIRNHYAALFDIGDFKNYISTIGSPLLYERVAYNQKIARNDGTSQDFYGTDFYNINTDPYIQPINSPNFIAYGINERYLDRVEFAGGVGVASAGGFSFKSIDFKDYLTTNALPITFSGVSTGKYTKENTLLFLEGTSVGDIYVGIDSASSKIHIGVGTASILSSMSSSISQSSSVTILVSSQDSVLTVAYNDGSGSIYYDFGSNINYSQSTAYLFNRYYTSSTTYQNIAVGNSEIDFDHAYAGDDNLFKVYLTSSVTNIYGSLTWAPQQKSQGMAIISIPVPNYSQNYFYSNHSSDNIQYLLYVDGTSSSITNESIINIPTTSSNVYISACLTNYWNSPIYDISKNIYIKDIAIYNFGPASFTNGSYPAIIELSKGLANDQDNYLNIFKQKNIGFLQTASNIITIYKTDTNFDDIGQIDFLIAIPDVLVASTQYLIDSSVGASMTLTNSSGSYILNFSGLTASVNGTSATSGATKLLSRQHYFVQASFNSGVASNSFIYMFSASTGSYQFTHSFDRLSVFPTSASNAASRYAQIFGRKTFTVSDNHQNYLRVESLPDETLLLNKTWQVYST